MMSMCSVNVFDMTYRKLGNFSVNIIGVFIVQGV